MEGEPQYTDREDVITHIDDVSQIHGTWGGCAIIPEIDIYYSTKSLTITVKLLFLFHITLVLQMCFLKPYCLGARTKRSI